MTSFALIIDDAAQYLPENLPANVRLIEIHHPLIHPNAKLSKKEDPGRILPDFLPLKSISLIPQINKTDLTEMLTKAIREFDEIFCLPVSGGINPLFSVLEHISSQKKGRANFHLIDSHTVSAGQGYLYQRTLQLIRKNLSPLTIDESLRKEIPNIYSLFSTPNFSYLLASHFIDAGQAISGEQHSMYPVFGLEDGEFTALEKQKNIHGVIEYFIEFIGEYDQLKEITFLHPSHHQIDDAVNLVQFIHDNIPGVKYSEIRCNDFLSHLIGPRGFGLIVVE